MTVNGIKAEMLAEHEKHGRVDVRSWLARLPDLPDDLLDFACWLEVSSNLETESLDGVDDSGVAENALRQGLELLSVRVAEKERRLAVLLAQERNLVARQRNKGKARAPFRKAAVQTWVFDQLRGDRDRVSRYITYKTVYLVERALDLGLFTTYRRMKAGPYDPQLRYKDAEPIARDNHWIVVEGLDLLPGRNIGQVYKYAPSYLGGGRAAGSLIRLLSRVLPWDLETLTTVDTAAQALLAREQPVTGESVTSFLAADPEWKDKLHKRHFSIARIKAAIEHLSRLGLLHVAEV